MTHLLVFVIPPALPVSVQPANGAPVLGASILQLRSGIRAYAAEIYNAHFKVFPLFLSLPLTGVKPVPGFGVRPGDPRNRFVLLARKGP